MNEHLIASTAKLFHYKHYLSNFLDESRDIDDGGILADKDEDDPTVDDIDKAVPLSSLTWEAYELSSDWSKSLKGSKCGNLMLS